MSAIYDIFTKNWRNWRFDKLDEKWMPKHLTPHQKTKRIVVPLNFLQQYHDEGNECSSRRVLHLKRYRLTTLSRGLHSKTADYKILSYIMTRFIIPVILKLRNSWNITTSFAILFLVNYVLFLFMGLGKLNFLITLVLYDINVMLLVLLIVWF